MTLHILLCCGIFVTMATVSAGAQVAGVEVDPVSPKDFVNTGLLNRLVQSARDFEKGENGMPQNPLRAFDMFRQAAAQGNLEARYELARCHAEGVGTVRDIKKAKALFEALAADMLADRPYEFSKNPLTGHAFVDRLEVRPYKYKLSNFVSKGRTFQSPQLQGTDLEGIRIIHLNGIDSLSWEEVPSRIQEEAGYHYVEHLFKVALEKVHIRNAGRKRASGIAEKNNSTSGTSK